MTEPMGRGGPQPIPRPPEWRRVDVEPYRLAQSLAVAVIEDRLADHEPGELRLGPAVKRPPEPGRRSAVLIAIYDGEDGPTTILTRRPQHMRKHAGEIAFPGGGLEDDDDSLWDTAVREAQEEVALDPGSCRQIGMLDQFITGASYSLVQPYVAVLNERPDLIASPDEVEAILHVPLTELAHPDTYWKEEWLWDGEWRPMHFFGLVGDTVWGATAIMVHQLLSLLATH